METQRERRNSKKKTSRSWGDDDKSTEGLLEKIALFLSYALLVIFFPLSIFFCVLTVKEFERAVILRNGHLRKGGARGPGIVFYLPCVDQSFFVDVRLNSFEVEPQAILTKDSVTIRVDAIVYSTILEPIKSVLNVVNANEATQNLAQTTLRNVVGSKKLVELLSSRELLSKEIRLAMDEATRDWGVRVERVEMKDIRLPEEMQRALAQEAEALREAKAKIIAANGEMEASKNLKIASDIMKDSPITLQLRYLQTLSIVSQEQNATIVFPVPIDILPPGAV